MSACRARQVGQHHCKLQVAPCHAAAECNAKRMCTKWHKINAKIRGNNKNNTSSSSKRGEQQKKEQEKEREKEQQNEQRGYGFPSRSVKATTAK